MRKKSVSGMILTLLLASVLTLTFKIQSVRTSPTTITVPDDYSTIQEAINNANTGDTIYVRAGTYNEHISMGKPVKLVGESRWTTIISGLGMENQSFWGLVEIHSSNVTVNGFTIRDWTTGGGMGIYMTGSHFGNISDNFIVNHEYGIDMRNSRNNFIGYNMISRSTIYGMVISERSENNILRGNDLNQNDMNLGVFSYFNDIDSSNTADEKPIYYWVNQKDKQIPKDAGYVALINSTNIVIKDLTISNNQGVLLAYTNNSIIENVGFSNTLSGVQLDHSYNNTIQGCAFTKNTYGISMSFSNKNHILGNTISASYNDGISLYSSNENIVVNNTISIDWIYADSFLLDQASSNMIHHNNIIHRYGRGVFLPISQHNSWDNGAEGNFWSNYNGTDTDGDGTGDTPYVIDALNQDKHPLMNLWPGCPDTLPPTANAGEDKIAPQDVIVEFNGSDSYDNVGIVSYEWNFGDGTSATGRNASHMYDQPYGTITKYKVTLTVRDAKGNNNSTSIIVSILRDSNKDGIPDISDSDNDGMPDVWETKYGLNPYDSADATGDPDRDLLLNIEEYHLGTDPHVFNISWKNVVFILAFCLGIAAVTSIWLLHNRRTLRRKRESTETIT